MQQLHAGVLGAADLVGGADHLQGIGGVCHGNHDAVFVAARFGGVLEHLDLMVGCRHAAARVEQIDQGAGGHPDSGDRKGRHGFTEDPAGQGDLAADGQDREQREQGHEKAVFQFVRHVQADADHAQVHHEEQAQEHHAGGGRPVLGVQ